MSRMVQCAKLGKELEGLLRQTYPGELGQRIFDTISQQAWTMWMDHQTILMNENKLTPINPEHRKFLEQEMEKFLFGDGATLPDQFKPQS